MQKARHRLGHHYAGAARVVVNVQALLPLVARAIFRAIVVVMLAVVIMVMMTVMVVTMIVLVTMMNMVIIAVRMGVNEQA